MYWQNVKSAELRLYVQLYLVNLSNQQFYVILYSIIANALEATLSWLDISHFYTSLDILFTFSFGGIRYSIVFY